MLNNSACTSNSKVYLSEINRRKELAYNSLEENRLKIVAGSSKSFKSQFAICGSLYWKLE